jgi:hypothetical protein
LCKCRTAGAVLRLLRLLGGFSRAHAAIAKTVVQGVLAVKCQQLVQ